MPKEKGNNEIHRVQIIHIYEVDYSALIGVTWRDLIQSLEARYTIHQGQVGGKAGHDANTLTFMEEIKMRLATVAKNCLLTLITMQHCAMIISYQT
eukprot:11343891-Ditylum_brightwellii.AAC.1